MSRKTVRVEIPVGSPDKMIVLSEDIKARHDALAGASPLDDAQIGRAHV